MNFSSILSCCGMDGSDMLGFDEWKTHACNAICWEWIEYYFLAGFNFFYVPIFCLRQTFVCNAICWLPLSASLWESTLWEQFTKCCWGWHHPEHAWGTMVQACKVYVQHVTGKMTILVSGYSTWDEKIYRQNNGYLDTNARHANVCKRCTEHTSERVAPPMTKTNIRWPSFLKSLDACFNTESLENAQSC